MSKELYRNKLMIDSPTSISLGHITWFALDTKLVGRIKALLKERDDLQSKIDEAIEYIEYLDKNIEWADDIDFGDLECIKNILLGGDE